MGLNTKNENWEGYMVNTIYAHEVEYMICMREKENDEDPDEYFKFIQHVNLYVLECVH